MSAHWPYEANQWRRRTAKAITDQFEIQGLWDPDLDTKCKAWEIIAEEIEIAEIVMEDLRKAFQPPACP